MAGLIETKTLQWRLQAPDFDKNMVRLLEWGALDTFLQQTNAANSIIPDEVKRRAEASMGNEIAIPVIDYDGDVTVSNTRTCVVADAENTSKIYVVSFNTYAVGYTMVPTLYMNNEIGYNRDYFRKYEKSMRALGQAIDQACVAVLSAEKTQVLLDAIGYTFTSNTIQAPTQMGTEVIGDIDVMMRANGYNGKIHMIGNAGILSLMRKLAQHGANNDVNKTLEYAGKQFHYSNNVTNESGQNGTFYAVEDGNLALLFRYDREASIPGGVKAGDHEWGKVYDPITGLTLGTHYYLSVGDQSGIAGAASADIKCARKEHFSFSVDVAYIVAYNSDKATIPQPIIKANIAAASPNVPMAATPVYVVNNQ